MLTINELIIIVDNHILRINNIEEREKLNELRKELIFIKKSPELSGSCSIDFKIANSDKYLDRINIIVGKK